MTEVRIVPGERVTHPRRLTGYLLELLLFIVTLGLGWYVWFAFLAGKGQTPAKHLLHLYVYDFEIGTTAAARRMWAREVGIKYVLPTLTGFLIFLVPSPIGGLLFLALQIEAISPLIVFSTPTGEPPGTITPVRWFAIGPMPASRSTSASCLMRFRIACVSSTFCMVRDG